MRIGRTIVHVMAAGGLAIGGVIANAGVAGAAPLTARQQSQVAFLMRYTHFRDGQRPTYAEAVNVLDEYGSRVLTLAEADVLFHPKVTAVFPHHYYVGQVSGCLGQGSYNDDKGGLFGYVQDLSFCFNSVANSVTHYSTWGYDWISVGVDLLVHFDGLTHDDNLPRWTSGYEQCGGYFYRKYLLQANFTDGYGPLAAQIQLDIYILGDADGGYAGGEWG